MEETNVFIEIETLIADAGASEPPLSASGDEVLPFVAGEQGGRAEGTLTGAGSTVKNNVIRRPKPPALRLLTVAELKKLDKPEWLIEDVMPQGSLAVLYGAPGAGKSFLALDWVLSAAKGEAWVGHGMTQGPSVYIWAEGLGGLVQRIEAWETVNGPASSDSYFVTEAVQLAPRDSQQVGQLLDIVSALPDPPKLFVFDTLARCAVGVEENSAKEIGFVIQSADWLRRETGAAVLLCHHMRKAGESERGSTALRGAADVMMKLDRNQGSLLLSCEKMKDAVPFERCRFVLDEIGESCVLRARGEPVPNELTPGRRTCLEALHEAATDDGLSATAWLKTSEEPESSFYKIRKELIRAGYVEQRDKRYLVTKEGRIAIGLLSDDSNDPPVALTPTPLHNHTPIGGGVEGVLEGAPQDGHVHA
jgi:hypothetical protein